MKVRIALYVSAVMLVASLASAQVPCGGAVLVKASLFVNWPQFQYDTAHTGCNPYESVLKPSTVGNLAIKWQNSTGGEGAYTTSAVVDGLLYTTAYYGRADYIDILEVKNASTGASLWTFTTGEILVSLTPPVVGNGLVYVGATNHNLYALDTKTGALVWQYATADYVSTPTVVNGVVYVGSDQVYALNASTGALIWKSPAGRSLSAPAVANGIVYVAATPNVVALNASTGDTVWSSGIDSGVYPALSVAGGKVFVASGQISALNASTGALIWSYPVSSHFSPVAVARGMVYVGSDDNYIYALNGSTGALVWNHDMNGSTPNAPAVANGVVYVSSELGPAVTALDAGTGAFLWKSAQGADDCSTLTVANGVIYVGVNPSLETGHLYAYSLNGQ